MGLDVELIRIDRAGTGPRRRRDVELAAVLDTRYRFAEAVERGQHRGSTPMLDRIDLYGTLELSCDEMTQFLAELDQLRADAANDAERDVLEAVRGLAVRCRDGRLALRFVGD